MISNEKYIRDAIRNPKYIVLFKGREVKRYAFYRQAINFAKRYNDNLFEKICCEVVNAETGEIYGQ